MKTESILSELNQLEETLAYISPGEFVFLHRKQENKETKQQQYSKYDLNYAIVS